MVKRYISTKEEKTMIDNLNTLTAILTVVIIAIVILIAVLALVYVTSKTKKEKKQKHESDNSNNVNAIADKTKTFAVESVFDFMEFDKIEDNMIIQKKGNKYIMVVECQGINYDLMSEVEKNGVEEGFIQFLNTIRYPIQIYTQTRTINLEGSIQTYKEKVKVIEDTLEKQELQYKDMVSSGRYSKEQLDKAYYTLTKQRNLAEYGKDIIYTTEKMSLNKNVLNKKYYVVVPYYPEDVENANLDKEEIKNMAFSELYTRSQSILRTLAVCGINGKILSSNDLVDLLYVAYNRDEQETYGLDRAMQAGYDELYSTAPDVFDKKMKALDEKIEQEAFKKANEKVFEAKSEKQRKFERKEEKTEDLIEKMAKLIIEQNSATIGRDVAKAAEKKIDDEATARKSKKEGGTKENVQEKTKRRTTKTA